MPKGSRLVSAIAFSAQDKYISACDMSEKIIVHIFSVSGSDSPIADIQIGQKVLHMAWNPSKLNDFVTVGKDHIYFCEFDPKNNTVKKTKGQGNDSHSSVTYDDNGVCFTGGSDGKIHHWTGKKSTEYQVCKGAV